jgi:hypothetical protein
VVRGLSNYPLKLTVLPDWSRDRTLSSLAFPRPIRYPRWPARQLNFFVGLAAARGGGLDVFSDKYWIETLCE